MFLLMENGRWLFAAGAFCYCIATFYGLYGLIKPRQFRSNFIECILGAGLLIQLYALWSRGIETHSCPIGNPFETFQFITWALIALSLTVGRAFRKSLLGLFTGGLSCTLSIISLAIPSWDYHAEPRIFGGNPWIEAHASLAMVSYGFFLMLALTSVMFLLQNQALKKKLTTPLLELLPSIYELEQIHFRLLLVGNGIFTASILIGTLFYFREAEHILLAKLFFSISVWVGYLVLLLLRIKEKIKPKTVAWGAIFLCVWAFLTLWPVEQNRGQQHSVVTQPELKS
ncbi:MAG: cytochrome c biogenesis protein CcsA [Opitutales bacterium]|nr:cytochrome c biogenesis protein CcsA [Opitutales bacterium]